MRSHKKGASNLGSQMIRQMEGDDYQVVKLAAMEMKLEMSDAALTELATAGLDPVFGARPLKRAIRAHLENVLAREILAGHFAAKDTIRADFKDGKFVFAKG